MFPSVLLSLVVYMKIQMSAFLLLIQSCLCLQMLIRFFKLNFKCGILLRHESFGLVCFFLNVMELNFFLFS